MTDPRETERQRLGVQDEPQRQRHRHDHADGEVHRFVIDAARLLSDRHCEDVVAFDVRGLSQLTDYILIATGTSDRQMKAVGGEVADLARDRGMTRYGSEHDDAATWIVLDFVEVMLHLFEPAARSHYDLEMMWDDAKRIPWRRTAEGSG